MKHKNEDKCGDYCAKRAIIEIHHASSRPCKPAKPYQTRLEHHQPFRLWPIPDSRQVFITSPTTII